MLQKPFQIKYSVFIVGEQGFPTNSTVEQPVFLLLRLAEPAVAPAEIPSHIHYLDILVNFLSAVKER